MTSVYQAAPAQDKEQMNGGKAIVPEEAKPVPGTSLKCLEDPQFSFDGGANAVAPLPKPRKPTYKGWVWRLRPFYHVSLTRPCLEKAGSNCYRLFFIRKFCDSSCPTNILQQKTSHCVELESMYCDAQVQLTPPL